MKDFLSMDQDCNVWVLLSQAAHTALRAREKELDQYGVSAIEAAVLFIIQAIGDRATPAEISRWLLRESHSVSGLLNRMERKGLVSRVKDLERKNLVRVALTEKGKAVYRESRERKSIRNILSPLSQEEREQLRLCLERIRNKALKELGLHHQPPFPKL